MTKIKEEEVDLEEATAEDSDAEVEEVEEEETAKPVAKKKTAKAKVVNTKKVTKINGNGKKTPRKARTEPYTNTETLIGRAWAKAKSGIKIKVLNAWCDANKTKKKGGTWVPSFLRRGYGNGFKWDVDITDGVLTVSNWRPMKKKAA